MVRSVNCFSSPIQYRTVQVEEAVCSTGRRDQFHPSLSLMTFRRLLVAVAPVAAAPVAVAPVAVAPVAAGDVAAAPVAAAPVAPPPSPA